MAAVAVTEPDFGSDVAGIKVTATLDGDDYVINGVKTWCTFAARADVLMLLARTGAARLRPPRPQPVHRAEGTRRRPRLRAQTQDTAAASSKADRSTPSATAACTPTSSRSTRGACRRPISSAATRALGKGFYLQMAGFENGRLQTAARAIGVMQAAYEAAVDYARQPQGVRLAHRRLPAHAGEAHEDGGDHPGGAPVQLPGRPADGDGQGSMEASLVKAYVCRAAEWVTREALQIHGGMGYAEEFPVSRYFVDARVLSIFEGADETLDAEGHRPSTPRGCVMAVGTRPRPGWTCAECGFDFDATDPATVAEQDRQDRQAGCGPH